MRFFSGGRGGSGDKKKVSASALFKLKASGKVIEELTPAEKFKKRLDDKMQQMMEDAIMGKKKAGPRIPGTKAEPAQEAKPLTKNAKIMLEMLAMKRLKKEEKIEKKKAREKAWAEGAKKRAAALAKAQKEAAEWDKKVSEEAAAAAAAAAEYHAKQNQDNNGGGWW